jgi:histidinol-phosphate/aromatic aminotransferase/cobyric acid decarboxylase-like protein
MNGTDLQARLAYLAPEETLLLPAAKIEQVFYSYPTPEERRKAAARLAALYQCSLVFCGAGGSQALFTRYESFSPAPFA